MRLSPVQVWSDGSLDPARLVDRDATTTVRVQATTRVFLRFARPVAPTRLKVQGARSLRVTAEDTGALGPAEAGGWASAAMRSDLATLFVIQLEPQGTDAEVAEIEIWGAGETRASLDPAALAAATRPGLLEERLPAELPGPLSRLHWMGDDVVAIPAAARNATLVPRGAADGADCLATRFEAGALVHGARRAYLAYEANLHRAIELRRSVGGAAPVGGLWIGTAAETTLADEIDPERLTGTDSVLLCLPIEATSRVTIEGLRLLLVLDRGANAFDRDAELASAAALDGSSATRWDAPGSRVELGFDRLTAIEEASIRTAGTARLHAVGTSDGQAWSEQGGVDLADGSTPLELGGRLASALELTFEGGAGAPVAQVAELSVTGSGAGPGVAANRLVISYPRLTLEAGKLVGERFDGEAYVAGWAESPRGPGSVEIEGATVDVAGAFGARVTRPVGATAGWAVTVRARFPDGGEIVKVIHLDRDRAEEIQAPSADYASDEARFGAENGAAWGVLRASGGKVTLGTDVSLEAGQGAVGSDTSVGIARKGYEVMPKLDAGMVNVTAPAHFAYRFLPAGQVFERPVKLTLPYDPELLPEGMLPEEIQTYYYDRDQRRWLTLPRSEVRRDTRQIVSTTTHFTFMINAVLVLPEHPGPVSFNPNSIKDLKAADPSAGIDLVEPPSGNAQGTANVSFPIRLPKARGAYQPSLALAYDSGGANGWLGVGWDLPVSSVSIDTRYGVPVYDGEERYLLDGAQLVPVGASAPCTDDTMGRGYMARVERDFRRIVRCGDDPTSYWFEVTDKAGTLHVYGREPDGNARLTSYVPHLYGIPRYPPAYDIGQWFLERVVDANGNLTRFVYQHDNRDRLGDPRFMEDFRQVYLSDVWYTGRATRNEASVRSDGPYHVQLAHRPGDREDLVTSGRVGFKVVTRKLLGSIKVELNGAPIREYVLEYEPGDFWKSRLKTVIARAADGTEFYRHGLEYTGKDTLQATGRVAAFAPTVATWAPPPEGNDEYALTGSTDKGAGGHSFFGISIFQPKSSGTIGFALDFNDRTSKTEATFLDVNGDGLPDRLFRTAGAWLSRPASGVQGPALTPLPRTGVDDPFLPAQGPAFLLPGKQSLGSESSSVFTGAVQVMGFSVLAANFGGSYSTTRARDLVIDANGDGLPDLVNDGQIWFNQPACTATSPETACFQRGIPAPVLQDPQIPIALETDDPASRAPGPASDAKRDALSPEDVVLEWTAPFEGVVDVTGAIRFVDEVLREGRHDGVRLRIYHATPPWAYVVQPPLGDPISFNQPSAWAQVGSDVVKFPDDLTVTHVAHQVAVSQGDTLYFVLSTQADFPLGTRADGKTPYSPEQVGFAPVVTYLFTGSGQQFVDEDRRDDVDPTGRPLYRYDSAADLRLAGDQQLTVAVPRSGTLRVSGTLQKDPASDDVVACARLFAPGTYDPADTACSPNDPTGTPIYLALPSSEESTRTPSFERHVDAGTILVFWVKSRLSIDPASVDWKIDGEMACVDEGGTCRALEAEDPLRASLTFRGTPNVPLHAPALPQEALSAWLPDGRSPVPFDPPMNGTLHVTVRGALAWDSLPLLDRPVYAVRYLASPTTFAVRSPRKLYAQWTLPRAVPQQELSFYETLDLPVEEGVPVFFDAHNESGLYGPYHYSVSNISFEYQDGDTTRTEDVFGPGAPSTLFTTCARGLRNKLGNAPILGGGFHGWRFGLWQGRSDEPFQPWVYRTPHDQEFPVLDLSEVPISEEKKREAYRDFYRWALPPLIKERDARERQRARLLGVLAPSADGTRRGDRPGVLPGVPGWVSSDANAFIVAGGMNAARRGAKPNGPNEGRTVQANAWFAGSGRTSVATTLTAGLSVGPLSLSLSSGLSHQEQDLLDLNGDRIPDVLQGGSVPDISGVDGGALSGFLGGGHSSQARITDPAGLTPRNLVSVPVQPRLNVDLGGQAGLGLTEAVKLLRAKNQVASVSGRMPDFTAGVGVGVNVSTTVEDLVDVNGDGLPDAVRKNGACGGFSVRLNLGNAFANGEDCLGTYGWGANVLPGLAGQLDPSRAVTNDDGGSDSASGLGVARGIIGHSQDASALRQVSTVTLQGNVGGGGAIDQYESYGASVSSESSLTSTNVALVDVTGDGLPDFVAKGNTAQDFLVSVNLGYGFAAPRRWSAPSWPPGARPNFRSGLGSGATLEGLLTGFVSATSNGIDPVEATGTHTDLPNASFVFTIAFPLAPPLPSPWMQISFGANATLGRTTGSELGLQDIDGDGFADHVLKKRGGGPVHARVSQLSGGNLLRRVTRPLGGSFDLEYARVGNTVDMPESRYALTRVTVHDGVGSGTGHDLATRYEYAGGKYDRNEREFLGFQTVTRRNADETKLVQTFLNGDYRYKGLLEREAVLDAKGRTFVETVNAYLVEPVGGAPQIPCVQRAPINLKYEEDLYCASRFVRLSATEKRIYEGEVQARVVSRQSFEDYDDFGNVTTFHDWGDYFDPDDDVWATVTYGPAEAAAIYCVGAPTAITVTSRPDSLANPLRKRTASYDSRCNMTELRSLVSGSIEAVANVHWYPEGHAWAGNLWKVQSPLNHRDQRYEVEYEYDDVISAYVTKTTDVHHYVSEAEYDYALGENLWTKDVNGQVTSREFDRFGRLWRVAAPGFTLSSPTIEISYSPDATVPRALTKNRLPGGGMLDTVVLIDGIGRVIQTKKTAEVWTGSLESTKVGWAVKGHQRFDALGRVVEQGQTFFDANPSPAYSPGTPKNSRKMVYDVLGRTFQTVEPNGAVTRTLFGFGTPAGTSITRRKTTAVDPLGKTRVVYEDASVRTVAVEDHIEGRTPTTHYAYDRLGQLVEVTDAAGNRTRVEYDLLGRRTRLDNRDTGATVFAYDRAGNLVSRQDARNVVTTYVYDFERLKEIRYPTELRNVIYEYGAPGAAENAAGRITRIDDEVGTETRGYDVLGNLARTTRTIDPLAPSDRPRTYTTTFQFDVFGRTLSMVYPDGETLTYAYDAGGLLRFAQGSRPATKWDPAQTETYLAKLLYDEFGQRRYQRVGNGVVTRYEYDPVTRRLSWLHAQKPGERLLQNLVYAYDLIGNVLGVKNALGEPEPPNAGTVEFTYRYDDLHRLVYADGKAKSRPRTTDTFTSSFQYSDIHNMLSNVQVHHVLHGPTGGGEYPPHTNHDLAYQYTAVGPHQATRIGDTSLVYDESGNTLRECRDPADATCTQRPSHLRRYLWTEENRLEAVIDGGGKNITKFFYDADGQRIAKLGRGGESITIGQFWALKGKRAATKHVFAGTARIASKLLPPPGWDDTPPPDPAVVTTVDTSGCNPSNYQPQKCEVLQGGEPVLNDYYAYAKVRPETYYYHSDHLGSTSWVTDQNARVHERVEYFPHGAVWRDPRSDIGASPVKGQRFLFTGKELDEETGLYYFGARYYDPVRVRWVSPDPVLAKYLPDQGEGEDGLLGFGGVFNTKNLGLYSYAHLNPLIFTDPDGEFVFLVPIAIVVVKAIVVSAATGAVTSAVISAGAQYAFTGEIDPGKVARDAAIGAVLGGAMGGIVKGTQLALAARAAAQAAQQAKRIHAAIDPIAQSMRTTAVAGQGAAKVATGSGKAALTGAQRSVAQQLGAVPSRLSGAGVHAESKALAELAKAAGGKADAYLGISRTTGFCPGCASELGAAGWVSTSPVTAILPVVNYGTQAAAGAVGGAAGGVGAQCVAE